MQEFSICGLTACPGEKTTGYVTGPDGRTTIPLAVINGERPGKTALLTAGIHACEYPGAAAAMELIRTLDPGEISGQVVIAPMVNITSFYDRIPFVVREDGKNLNRVFPGNPAGSYSQQLADFIRRELHSQADCCIDIHSGDAPEMVMPFVYYPAGAAPAVRDAAERMCQAMTVSCRVASRSQDGAYGSAAAMGVPSILIERGGRCGYTRQEQTDYLEDLRRILIAVGILDGEPLFNTAQKNITESAYYDAEATGCWHPYIQAGERFTAGMLLGEVTDFFGEVYQRITAPFDGFLLYGTVSLAVKKGESLLALAKD